MNRIWIGLASAFVCVLAASTPAAAQDGDDWDFGEDAARDLAVAAVTFDNFGVAVRCMNDNLSVVLSGLPVASGERTLRYRVGDRPDADSLWVSDRDSTTAFAVWPRGIAANLSRGGVLVLDAPDGERSRRYTVDLPASQTSIGRVFQACGKELSPPQSATAPSGESLAGIRWLNPPRPRFPDRTAPSLGLAGVICVVRANGTLRACTIESEFPEGSGFGRAATFGAHTTGRVAPVDPSGPGIEGRMISFVTRYSMDPGGYMTPPPSRIPRQDEINFPAPEKDEAE